MTVGNVWEITPVEGGWRVRLTAKETGEVLLVSPRPLATKAQAEDVVKRGKQRVEHVETEIRTGG